MKVIYEKNGKISLDGKAICFYDGLYTSFCIDNTIPLSVATKLFQRFHQIDQDAELEFIVRALNDALNSELTVWINDCSTPVYHGSCFDSEMIRAFICDNSELVSDEFHFNLLSVKHNITEDRVEYFIDDKLKGWLPIIRKEIAS